MKLLIFVCLFSTLTIVIPQARGDVVVDLFGKIKESAQKIGDDIKIVFQSNGRNNQYKYEPVRVSQTEGYDPDKIVFERPVTTTQAAVTTVKSDAKVNETDLDGRENFRGACATGYERTADGRCKPTF